MGVQLRDCVQLQCSRFHLCRWQRQHPRRLRAFLRRHQPTVSLIVDCEQVRTNACRLPDPFRNIEELLPPVNWGVSSTTVTPARFPQAGRHQCLGPGLYYVQGSLTIKGNIGGSGVTIFMANGGITINGNASLSLIAPKAPDLCGNPFMSARSSGAGHKFNENGATDLNGVLYFPASP